MNPRLPAPGFILVGVVMFVLALTILGLSLFTLSSYEAQSLTQSHARQQGSYDAESGIEMVKALVMTPPSKSLLSATSAVGSYNVVSAVAMQHRLGGAWDSVGSVSDDDSTLLIRVTSQNYGERRTLEARFTPNAVPDYYKRLFTVAMSVLVENAELNPPTNHPASQLRLSGGCWQFVDSASDTTWLATQTTWTGPTFQYTDPVTLPSISNYVANHTTPYTVSPVLAGSNQRNLDFTIHPDNLSVAYYKVSTNPTSGSPFSYEDDIRTLITVKDTVVWIVPAGVRFNTKVEIQKLNAPAVLIIVAGANNAPPPSTTSDYAIHFKGGLNVVGGDQVSVIMATDRRVVIEFVNAGNTYEATAEKVSILCRDLQLMGPNNNPNPQAILYNLTLHHYPSMDQLINNLYANPSKPLPAPPAPANALSVVRGSWRSPTP
ncbi:MAG: hypothetical protein ABIU54_01170 [Candidatus Eisenbacteria bacterium]